MTDRRPIRERLAEFYTPEEIHLWLKQAHPQLGMQSAGEVIRAGGADRVHEVIDRLEADAYL